MKVGRINREYWDNINARFMLDRFPPWLQKSGGGPMPRKGGNETVLGSTRFRCSPMRECDTYLEFCMSKDSIGAAELWVGHPCLAQGQFKSRKGAKMSPWRHPGDNLATTWRQPSDTLATTWSKVVGALVPRPISWEWVVGTWLVLCVPASTHLLLSLPFVCACDTDTFWQKIVLCWLTKYFGAHSPNVLWNMTQQWMEGGSKLVPTTKISKLDMHINFSIWGIN